MYDVHPSVIHPWDMIQPKDLTSRYQLHVIIALDMLSRVLQLCIFLRQKLQKHQTVFNIKAPIGQAHVRPFDFTSNLPSPSFLRPISLLAICSNPIRLPCPSSICKLLPLPYLNFLLTSLQNLLCPSPCRSPMPSTDSNQYAALSNWDIPQPMYKRNFNEPVGVFSGSADGAHSLQSTGLVGSVGKPNNRARVEGVAGGAGEEDVCSG